VNRARDCAWQAKGHEWQVTKEISTILANSGALGHRSATCTRVGRLNSRGRQTGAPWCHDLMTVAEEQEARVKKGKSYYIPMVTHISPSLYKLMVSHTRPSPGIRGPPGSQSTEEEITMQYSNQIVVMVKSNHSRQIKSFSDYFTTLIKIESHGAWENEKERERVHRKKKRGHAQA
jgi:hypothetical protein